MKGAVATNRPSSPARQIDQTCLICPLALESKRTAPGDSECGSAAHPGLSRAFATHHSRLSVQPHVQPPLGRRAGPAYAEYYARRSHVPGSNRPRRTRAVTAEAAGGRPGRDSRLPGGTSQPGDGRPESSCRASAGAPGQGCWTLVLPTGPTGQDCGSFKAALPRVLWQQS